MLWWSQNQRREKSLQTMCHLKVSVLLGIPVPWPSRCGSRNNLMTIIQPHFQIKISFTI